MPNFARLFVALHKFWIGGKIGGGLGMDVTGLGGTGASSWPRA